MTFRIAACTLLLLLAYDRPAVAQMQPRGRSVTGMVTDEQGHATIAGVRVRLGAVPGGDAFPRSDSIGVNASEAVSDAQGTFRFDAVQPGLYRLSVQLDGFGPFDYPLPITVAEDADPAPVVIKYPLRMTTEVSAEAAAAAPVETAAGSTLNTLPGQAVVQAPGALEDVMRVLQARPGVAAVQDDRNDMLVRGGGAIENATRIDGFDIPNPSHFGTPGSAGGAFAIVAPWLIDRAVLRAGGFSVEFGERASSVLDLALRTPAGDRVRGQAGAGVGGAMGEAEGTFDGGRGSWLVSARRSFLQLTLARGGDRAVPHYGDAIARFEYAITPAHRVELLGIAAFDDVLVTSAGSTGQLRDDQTVTLFGASLRSAWNAATTTALVVSHDRTSIDAQLGGTNSSDGSDRSTEAEWRLRGEMRHRLGRDGEVLAGVSIKRPDLRFNLDAKGFSNLFGVWVAPLSAHFPYSFVDVGGYAEVRLPAVSGLRVTPGVRVDRFGTTGHVFASPRVNGEYRLTDRVKLTGAYGVYRQTLPYVWMGSDIRNASLDPVRSRQALAGVSVLLPGGTRLVVEGFDKRYSGYPVDASAEWWHVLVDAAADYESPFVGRLAGAGRLFAHGIDGTIGRRFWNRLDVNASYSYWRVHQLSEAAPPSTVPTAYRVKLPGWRRADYDIRHQARLELAYDSPGRLRVAAQFRYADGRPYTPYDARASVTRRSGFMYAAAFNSALYPPYNRLDVRVDRVFEINGTRLVVYGELDNVYNRDNLYLYEWNRATKRSVPVYQWGRQPIGGIRWEF